MHNEGFADAEEGGVSVLGTESRHHFFAQVHITLFLGVMVIMM